MNYFLVYFDSTNALGEGMMFAVMSPDSPSVAGSILILKFRSASPYRKLFASEMLSKETSGCSTILFMLKKLMVANILVSCSIFFLDLIFGNWPNCVPLWELGREREKDWRKRFVGGRDSLCMWLHTYVSWHKARLCGC